LKRSAPKQKDMTTGEVTLPCLFIPLPEAEQNRVKNILLSQPTDALNI